MNTKRHRKFNVDTKRVTVTLPKDMAEMYQQQADIAGCSLSWIIYTRLRSRGDIIILSNDVMREVSAIRKRLEELQSSIETHDNEGIAKIISILNEMICFYPLYQTDNGKEVKKYVI